MRILVVGAGAVGGYYGGRLLQVGRDVTFLLRDGRAAQIRERGLNLVSPRGDVSLQPPIVSAEQLRGSGERYDLILVSTKSYALDAAIEDFAPAVGPGSLVMPLLNGMRHLDHLDARFGREHVLGGTVRIMAEVLPNGDVWQHNPLDELTFGFRPHSAATTARSAQIREALTVFGFSTIESPDVIGAMWQKWWFLAAIGTTCLLAGGSLGEARRSPGGDLFTRAVLDECMAVAAANGFPPLPSLVEEMRERFGDPESTMTSSLYRDMNAGAAVESDQILGDFIRRANGTDVPLLRAAYVRLKVYEAQRDAARS
ncbi:ketopantoate reductase family protein [Terriglobus sp.]|uniref:ketopantoate reductase family protein n=1 Tax=Terriglobus sp. TaxID=1889013 RepID=UPI003B005894